MSNGCIDVELTRPRSILHTNTPVPPKGKGQFCGSELMRKYRSLVKQGPAVLTHSHEFWTFNRESVFQLKSFGPFFSGPNLSSQLPGPMMSPRSDISMGSMSPSEACTSI